MNVVDSSGWLAVYAETKDAAEFQRIVADAGSLIVPTISIFEIYRLVLRERGPTAARTAAASMAQARIVDLDIGLSIQAAECANKYRLAMADSIILATARKFNATLWTQDSDFDGIDCVRYLPRA